LRTCVPRIDNHSERTDALGRGGESE
jgi:hypothetical protein